MLKGHLPKVINHRVNLSIRRLKWLLTASLADDEWGDGGQLSIKAGGGRPEPRQSADDEFAGGKYDVE